MAVGSSDPAGGGAMAVPVPAARETARMGLRRVDAARA